MPQPKGAISEVLHSLLKTFDAAKLLISELGVVSSDLNSLFDTIQTDTLQLKTLLGEENQLTRTSRSSISIRSYSATESVNNTTQQFELSYESTQDSAAMSEVKNTIDCLDGRLKQCLLCLAIFPEGAVIKKQLLIHWWIGEGIVLDTEIGKGRFEELVYHGLIIPVKHEHCDEVHAFRVFPWIRQLLIEAAKENNFLELDPMGNPVVGTTNRVILMKGQKHVQARVRSFGRSSNQGLLSVYNVDQQYVHLDRSWFSGQKNNGHFPGWEVYCLQRTPYRACERMVVEGYRGL